MSGNLKDIKVNNLVFHAVEYRHCFGKLYAFVTCIDVQTNGKGKNKKNYWGEVSGRDNVDDITEVMTHGAKFDNIP